MARLDQQNRPPLVEVLPDGRRRVTRYYDVLESTVKRETLFESQVRLAWGTPDEAYAECRLVRQGSANSQSAPSADRALFIRVYEEIPATAEIQVGEDTLVRLEDGREAIEQTFLQFSGAPYTPATVGSAGPGSTFLQKEEASDDGAIRQIKRTFVTGGLLSQTDSDSNNGRLLRRTLVYARTVPPTPLGYVLVDSRSAPVNGFPVYTYTFAKGDGEVSRKLTLSQNGNVVDGSVGISRLAIVALTAPGGAEPTWANVGGYAKVDVDSQEADGHRVWRAMFAKGSGLVVDDIDAKHDGKLRTYHRVALGSAPSAPAAGIGGSVVLVENKVRQEEGFALYDYLWVEANGEISVSSQGRPDGSIVYVVTEFAADKATPASPVMGTYLVDLDQDAREGYWVNRATYVKLPSTDTIPVEVSWTRPGLASFAGQDLTLSPPVSMTILASAEVSYSTSKLETDPFTVTAYASFRETFIPYANRDGFVPGVSAPTDPTTLPPVTRTQGLNGYLADATSVSGSNNNYKGVACKSFSAVLVSSIPSSRPNGTTTLSVRNEEYLTALDGTKIYRRTRVTASL